MTAPESGTYSSPTTFGRPKSESSGPMKTYLKSQYHIEPPASGARTVPCDNFTHAQGHRPQDHDPRRVKSLLDGHRDVLIPARPGGRRFVVPTRGPRSLGGPVGRWGYVC